METILTPISPGELLDKISILEIKSEQIQDAEKVKNVTYELEQLKTVQEQSFSISDELQSLYKDLKKVNQELWDIEDDIRDCERQGDFGETFIGLARSVYITNDKRATLKREINDLLGSSIKEEKSYADY